MNFPRKTCFGALWAGLLINSSLLVTHGLRPQPLTGQQSSRRVWLLSKAPGRVAGAAAVATATISNTHTVVPFQSSFGAWAANPPRAAPPDLTFVETSSGLKYADAKVGTGEPIVNRKGTSVTIDYVMSTTGARYGSKIYATSDTNTPYRFQLGDGSTIQGLEMAIAGDSDGQLIEPMRPGGIRRVVIPASLAYESLARPLKGLQYQDCQEGKGVGPIPPTGEGNVAEYYQRFKNIYCNANRPYQPDLVMDVKLYGKR